MSTCRRQPAARPAEIDETGLNQELGDDYRGAQGVNKDLKGLQNDENGPPSA